MVVHMAFYGMLLMALTNVLTMLVPWKKPILPLKATALFQGTPQNIELV